MPVIHATSHIDHEKWVARFSMHVHGSVYKYSYEAPPELCYDKLKVTNHKILGA